MRKQGWKMVLGKVLTAELDRIFRPFSPPRADETVYLEK